MSTVEIPQELSQEFKDFLKQKRDAALAEVDKFNRFLEEEVKPKAEEAVLKSAETHKVLQPIAQETHGYKTQEIINMAKSVLTKQKNFLTAPLLCEQLAKQDHRFKELQPLELMNAITSDILAGHGNFRRLMVGHNIFVYGMKRTPTPNKDKIFYNIDAKKGEPVFCNITNVLRRIVKSMGDKPFKTQEIFVIVMNEFFFVKDKHIIDLRSSMSSMLHQMSKGEKPLLESAGDREDRIYSLLQ